MPVTRVASAVEFKAALTEGKPHIVVTSHLTFTREDEPMLPAGSASLGDFLATMLLVGKGTSSITGHCTEPTGAMAGLAGQWSQGQCVLEFVDLSGINVQRHGVDPLWCHNLILALSSGDPAYRTREGFNLQAGTAYLTDIAVQAGASYVPMRVENALLFQGKGALVAGSRIRNLGTSVTEFARVQTPGPVSFFSCTFDNLHTKDKRCETREASSCAASTIYLEEAVRLEECTFENNTAAYEDGIIARKRYKRDSYVYSDVQIKVRDLDRSIETSLPLGDGDAVGFMALTDSALAEIVVQVQDALQEALYSTVTLPDATLVNPDTIAGAPAAPSDPVPGTPQSPTALPSGPTATMVPPPDEASPTESSSAMPIIAGSVVGGIAVITALAIALFLWRRSSRRAAAAHAMEGDKPALPQPDYGATEKHGASLGLVTARERNKSQLPTTHTAAHYISTSNMHHVARLFASAKSLERTDMVPFLAGAGSQTTGSTAATARTHIAAPWSPLVSPAPGSSFRASVGTLAVQSDGPPATQRVANETESLSLSEQLADYYDRKAPPPPPPDYGQDVAALEALEDALDHMFDTQQAVLGRWEVLSALHRRTGGQGVVQFCIDRITRQDVVIKLFFDLDAFQRECDLYQQPDIREMMVAVVHIEDCRDDWLAAPRHDQPRLPPFIVLEKGESLTECALTQDFDYVSSLQVLVQIVDRLRSLHAVGLVHRDLKPANILWRVSRKWTLIDFGCAVRHGDVTSISCSLPYAPPEVAQALRDGRTEMQADFAMDIWSMGVVIWELFTRQRLFGAGTSAIAIVTALTEEERLPLPWESGSDKLHHMQHLGFIKRFVVRALQRDPRERPSADELLVSLNHALLAMTTKQYSALHVDT